MLYLTHWLVQLNDCWPVTSWSLVDYFLRPKPVYFSVARELRPVTVGIARYERKGPPPTNPKSATLRSEFSFAIWGTNATLEPISVESQRIFVILSDSLIRSHACLGDSCSGGV